MDSPIIQKQQSKLDMITTNRVLRNTYLMLALTLIFSAITASIAVVTNAGFTNIFIALIVIIGFPFLLQATRNSVWGVVFTFLYTGFIGWYIGPLLNFYIKNFNNGSELIMMALGSTGVIFLILTAISLNPNRNFTTWGRFLTIGIVVAFVACLINIFFLKMPALAMAISVIFALVSGGFIMYQTNAIVRGGESNYLTATVMIYVSLINIFLTLLQLLGMFAGNRN